MYEQEIEQIKQKSEGRLKCEAGEGVEEIICNKSEEISKLLNEQNTHVYLSGPKELESQFHLAFKKINQDWDKLCESLTK